jgi:hypothetical protein
MSRQKDVRSPLFACPLPKLVGGFVHLSAVVSLAVSLLAPCPASAQPPWQEGCDLQEGEPPCQDGYIDQYNYGCWAPPGDRRWVLVEGQGGTSATVCGRLCTYVNIYGEMRDVDWYKAYAAGGSVTLMVLAECAVYMVLWPIPDCGVEWDLFPQGSAQAYQELQLSYDFLPGQEFWFWITHDDFTGVPDEAVYVVQVGGIREGAVPARGETWGRIKSLYRQ